MRDVTWPANPHWLKHVTSFLLGACWEVRHIGSISEKKVSDKNFSKKILTSILKISKGRLNFRATSYMFTTNPAHNINFTLSFFCYLTIYNKYIAAVEPPKLNTIARRVILSALPGRRSTPLKEYAGGMCRGGGGYHEVSPTD